MRPDSWCNICWNQWDRKDCEGCVTVHGKPSKYKADMKYTPEYAAKLEAKIKACSFQETCVHADCSGCTMYNSEIKGVSKDTPKTTNAQGGSQSAVSYGFDCLDPKAMFAMCEALEEGRKEYGKDNWRKIPVEDHINHLLIHVFAYLAGDTQDDHLGHAMCRAMFAKAVTFDEADKKEG